MIRSSLLLAVSLALCGPTAVAGEAANPFTSPGAPIELGRSFEMTSKVLGDVRRINILLPDGYADPKEAETRYPVLYLLDGGAGWQDFAHIAAMAHQGGLWGANAPVIVVGIESKDRRAEFTRPSQNASEQRDFPTHGKGEAFHRFLVDELKPAVERQFRTTGEDALIGESLAGLFVAEEALRHGSAFRHYIAVSPSLWWDNGRLSREAAALLAKQPITERSMWFSMADEGGAMQEGMDRVVAALQSSPSAKLHWRYTPYPTEKHSTIYHLAATRAVRDTFPAAPPSK